MRRKNIVAMVTSLALVGAVAVGGTLALLTSNTKTLKNTFSVGEGYAQDGTDFVLKENVATQIPNDKDGRKAGDFVNTDATTEESNDYEGVIPASTLDKNPWFELTKDAPDSWVVACMTASQITALQEKGVTITSVVAGNEWRVVTKKDGTWQMDTDAVTPEDFTTAANYVDGKLYFVSIKPLVYDTNKTTDNLFTQLTVSSNMTKWEGDLNLDIKGVAVQKLDEATLKGSLQTIMTDAAAKLG